MSEKENIEETINPLSNINNDSSESILQDINNFKNKNILIILSCKYFHHFLNLNYWYKIYIDE